MVEGRDATLACGDEEVATQSPRCLHGRCKAGVGSPLCLRSLLCPLPLPLLLLLLLCPTAGRAAWPTPLPRCARSLCVWKPAEVIRSADLISYTAEEGVRFFGEVGTLCLLCLLRLLWSRSCMLLVLLFSPHGQWNWAAPAVGRLCSCRHLPQLCFRLPHCLACTSATRVTVLLRLTHCLLTHLPAAHLSAACRASCSPVTPSPARTAPRSAWHQRWVALGDAAHYRLPFEGVVGVHGAGSCTSSCSLPADLPTTALPHVLVFAERVGLQVPLGVVLAIPPFNYPVNLAVRWVAPRACGL